MLPGSTGDAAPVYLDPDAEKKVDSVKYTVEHWEEKRKVAWVADWDNSPWARESEDARLERVLKMALESGHPGIDEEGIDTMIGFVQQGRFASTHYIDMWSSRLAEMGVKVESKKGATEQLEELAAAKAAAEEAARQEAEEAEAELRRPKPPPHPRSLRLRLPESEISDAFTSALEALLRLLPYATLEESGRLRSRVRASLVKRSDYDEMIRLFSKATKYYGMYRVRLEPVEQNGEREEFHFTDRTEAARCLKKLWPTFHDGVIATRRRRLAHGAQNLGNEFNTTMELLIEQLWGSDEPEQEAFVVAIRRALADDERFEAVLSAVSGGEDEYGYRCVVIAGVTGPQKYHVVSPDQTTSLLKQLREEFVRCLDLRTQRDMAGENADDDDEDDTDKPDSELGDLQDMMEALAPMSGEALVAVAEEQAEEARWQSRLPSWGGRFLVGDLYAQAAWLRQHAAKGDPGLDELAATSLQAYVLWLLGGFATGLHWLYLAWKARTRRLRWVNDSTRALEFAVGGPPPPPHLVCGLSGKVMIDPHTLRTHAKGAVSANTPHAKMFSCDHTFSGQALLDFLKNERKCPRCMMKPYTLSPGQTAVRTLIYRNQKYDREIDKWFLQQLGIDMETQRRTPPKNVWTCLRHVAFYFVFNLCFWAARQWALWLAVDCVGSPVRTLSDMSCLWDEQPIEVAVLYTLHLVIAMVLFAHWTADLVALRHVSRQVASLQKVTLWCSESRSESWCYAIVMFCAWVAFGIWLWVTVVQLEEAADGAPSELAPT